MVHDKEIEREDFSNKINTLKIRLCKYLNFKFSKKIN